MCTTATNIHILEHFDGCGILSNDLESLSHDHSQCFVEGAFCLCVKCGLFC